MIKLSREIRFALTPPAGAEQPITNSWSGWPTTNAIVPYLQLRCVLEGQPDAKTGYLVNIKRVDQLLRDIVVEELIPLHHSSHGFTGESMLQRVFSQAKRRWEHPANIVSIALNVSPFIYYSIESASNSESLPMLQLTQQFEFSAAHRLHCDHLSAAENLATFGKCNNLEGHGHNYVVEVTVGRELDSSDEAGAVISLHQFESIVKERVVDVLDHKHLNRDVDYFASINPTVENIAVAIRQWLDGQFGSAKLLKVRVYETPKTWAEVSA